MTRDKETIGMNSYAVFIHEVTQIAPTYQGIVVVDGQEVYRSQVQHNPLQAVALALAWPDDPPPTLSDAEIEAWADAAFGGAAVKAI